MSGYTKLFSSILASTIWQEDHETRLVWITLLALADKHGVAEGSVPGLADFAKVSIDGCRRALVRLSSPDPDSRSQDQEGRRIEAVDGGWRLINHRKYRERMGADERREYLRQKQAEYRLRQRQSTRVNNVSDTDTLYTHTSPSPSPEVQEDPSLRSGSSLEAKSPSKPAAVSPALLTYPTIGTKGDSWVLTEAKAAEWRPLFPSLDVVAEARKALAWVQAHPDRRKTVRGMPAFLVSWLTRATDSTHGRGGPGPATKTAGNVGAAERFVARGRA